MTIPAGRKMNPSFKPGQEIYLGAPCHCGDQPSDGHSLNFARRRIDLSKPGRKINSFTPGLDPASLQAPATGDQPARCARAIKWGVKYFRQPCRFSCELIPMRLWPATQKTRKSIRILAEEHRDGNEGIETGMKD
jgi:hypothetical protein